MKNNGEWAVITGGSSGIGRELANQLAQEKYNLILVARNETALKETADEIENQYDINVKIVPTDLSHVDGYKKNHLCCG